MSLSGISFIPYDINRSRRTLIEELKTYIGDAVNCTNVDYFTLYYHFCANQAVLPGELKQYRVEINCLVGVSFSYMV